MYLLSTSYYQFYQSLMAVRMRRRKSKCLLDYCNNKIYLWHSAASKYSLENSQTSTHNDVITDVLHDASCLTSHQRQKDRGYAERGHSLKLFLYTTTIVMVRKQGCFPVTFVEVPEKEEFAPAGCGGTHVTEQVNAGIPEHPVKTQHHL